jgi:hypothetical protein
MGRVVLAPGLADGRDEEGDPGNAGRVGVAGTGDEGVVGDDGVGVTDCANATPIPMTRPAQAIRSTVFIKSPGSNG